MAVSATTELKILIKTAGEQGLRKLGRELSNLGVNTAQASFKFDKFGRSLKRQETSQTKSINNTRALSNAWKELAASVQFGSQEFKEATAEAKRLDAELAKMQGRKMGGMGRMARTAGAIAGAGVFGGPEGAIGAAIGGFMPGGGPISAAVGGAIGAQVGMVRQAIGSTAEYSAALGRQRKALRLVINDTKAYANSQRFLADRSKKLAIPQDVIVRQFTALTASVKGAGKSVEDAEKVFESIAAGIRGTGGSLEDMKAAMRATSQVFSKGKVSAEELRQQLGERLPGAFTIFAESIGKTPAQLDKMLEQGQVTLDDFMTFSETLFAKYGENAAILAAGPEAAGDRLQTALSSLKDNVGQLLRPVGAAFQDEFTDITTSIDGATISLRKFLKIGDEYIEQQIKAEERLLAGLQKQRDMIPEQYGRLQDRFPERYAQIVSDKDFEIAEQINKINKLRIKQAELNDEIDNTVDKTEKMGKNGNELWATLKAGASSYFKEVKTGAEQIKDVMENVFKGMEDALVNFVTTGKINFADFARSVIADITRIFIRSQMLSMFKGLSGLFGGGGDVATKVIEGAVTTPNWGGGRTRITNALGNVYAQNGIVPFAKGGIVSQPTIFPFKNGIGLMGEAGEEAVMPLRRGPGGRLGVEASGAGVGNIVVNVDASGSSVEGDAGQSEELGLMLGAAVQAEIVNQQRPGGLLAGTR